MGKFWGVFLGGNFRGPFWEAFWGVILVIFYSFRGPKFWSVPIILGQIKFFLEEGGHFLEESTIVRVNIVGVHILGVDNLEGQTFWEVKSA